MTAEDKKGSEPFGIRMKVFFCNGGALVRPEPMDGPDISFRFLPCTGAVSFGDLLAELQDGIDFVLLVGCVEGECRFPHPAGCPAQKLASAAQKLLPMLGLEQDRVSFIRCGPAPEVARAVSQHLESMADLGPSPIHPPGAKP